jgi:pre-mRNA-splicing factor ISY1
MARNTEKAGLMLNRWTAMKESMAKGGDKREERRPFLASMCKTLPEAERWRRDIVREIMKKVSEIQNPGIGEARTRDVNDEINKCIREKGHWERHIKGLGGPDYGTNSARAFDSDVLELPGSGGYKYFGAARELPGVKELFDAAKEKEVRRSRSDMMHGITPDYYGFSEGQDAALLRAEREGQGTARGDAEARWEAARLARVAARRAKLGAGALDEDDDDEEEEEEASRAVEVVAPVEAPLAAVPAPIAPSVALASRYG